MEIAHPPALTNAAKRHGNALSVDLRAVGTWC